MKELIHALIGLSVILSLCAAAGAGELDYTPVAGRKIAVAMAAPKLAIPTSHINVRGPARPVTCSVVDCPGKIKRASKICPPNQWCTCVCKRPTYNAICGRCYPS